MKVFLIVQRTRDGDGVTDDLDSMRQIAPRAKQFDNEGCFWIAQNDSDFRRVSKMDNDEMSWKVSGATVMPKASSDPPQVDSEWRYLLM